MEMETRIRKINLGEDLQNDLGVNAKGEWVSPAEITQENIMNLSRRLQDQNTMDQFNQLNQYRESYI